MLKTKNISLCYNHLNQQVSAFAENLITDIERCLQRFGMDYKVMASDSVGEGNFMIYIVAHSDLKFAEFTAMLKENYTPQHSCVVVSEPVDLHALKITNLSQPILFWEKSFETSEIQYIRNSSVSGIAQYWEKVTDITLQIKLQMEQASLELNMPLAYLGVVNEALLSERDNIARDLTAMGFKVVPSNLLSNNIDECTRQIENYLVDTHLIVHLIPQSYSFEFPSQHLSIAEHQCNIAAEMIRNGRSNAKRIVWIPSHFEISDEENQVFIERLQHDDHHVTHTKVIKAPIEDLKKTYRQLIGDANSDGLTDKTSTDLYIVTDSNGASEKDAVIKYAVNVGLTSESNANGITYRKHIEYLASSRIAIVCYTTHNKAWLKVKASEILKSRGVSTYQPFEKIILLKGSNEVEDEMVSNIFTNVVNNVSDIFNLLANESI